VNKDSQNMYGMKLVNVRSN